MEAQRYPHVVLDALFRGGHDSFYTDWGGLKLSEVLFLNSWFMLWNYLLEVPTGTVADS